MKQPSARMSIPNLPPLDPLRPDTAATDEKEPSTVGLKRLPAEIRLMILEKAFLLDVPKKQATPASGRWLRGKAAWPSVCSEWRDFFERRNFASLRLTSADEIETFNKVCVQGGRMRLVRRVRLHVGLRRYFALEGSADPERADEVGWNNHVFSARFTRLMRVLSAWEPTGAGLTLEFSASSPSDEEFLPFRRLPDFPPEAPVPPFLCTPRVYDSVRLLGNLLDFRSSPPSPHYGGGPLGDGVDIELPEVRGVTRLVVDRGYYRSFSKDAVRSILKSFTRLEEVSYEPWRGREDSRDEAIDALLRELPDSVRKVALWEAARPEWPFSKPDRDWLAATAVEASRRLEFFSACFAIDARLFFRDYYRDADGAAPSPPGSWPKLASLALTSAALGRSAPGEEADRLLHAAGLAAERMPELRVLELWTGRDRGFVFRYEADGGRARLTVEATWQYALSGSVLAAWQKTAGALTGNRLEVEVNHIRDVDSGGSVSMCDRLRLGEAVRVQLPY
ncbi:hypothetical protein LX32DRAFT_695479 [Colletotrichum zoysiae]|uniref:DUF6546 domain-containing protein n=1 Tax=Colletotrichum zoysiae TaxID=1216348 RepID=A0AAD9HDZ4_9PEZI|nr:hypothetical protein LX32DRAFT_695479 [Colletotrichum zoysiae]